MAEDTVHSALALEADRPIRCPRAADHSEAVQGFMTRTQSGPHGQEARLEGRHPREGTRKGRVQS